MRNIQEFPEHILELILLRLQVIDLLRSKPVCKRWNFVISSSHFVQLHLKKAISCPSNHRILIRKSGFHEYSSINYDDIYRGQVMNSDVLWPCKSHIHLLSSCDGLMSFVNYVNKSIGVLNPATRALKSLRTIKSLSRVLFHWFGHESVDDDDYKLVIGASSRDGGIHIHLIRPYADEGDCDSTQLINYKNLYFPTNTAGTLFNRRVHWFGCERISTLVPVVFCYDLRVKAIEEVPLPNKGMHFHATLCVMNGCLSAIQIIHRDPECIFEVWTMKEYGVKESWAKSTIFSCRTHNGPSDHLETSGIEITAEGDLIVHVGRKKVVSWNLREHKCKNLLCNGFIQKVILHVETLLSPQVSSRNN